MQGSEKEKRSRQVPQNCSKEGFEEGSEVQSVNGNRKASEAVKEKKASNEVRTSQGYSKAQLIASERFSGKRDALSALLSEEKEYSVYDAENAVEQFMKGRVK